MEYIRIRGARTHNLKSINLDLPRHQLVVITGLSGSGKSSLAFDTLYAEGQRRYVESLSAYARQFLQLMEKPDVDLIEGLSPAISIEQKATSHNPRSTVGTVTEIHDYLRLLFARVGDPFCPEHPDQKLAAMTISQMVDATLAMPEDTRLAILAPVVVNRKGEQLDLFLELRAKGFVRVRVDGKIYEIDAVPKLTKNTKHTVEVVVDRLKVRPDLKQRLAESYETALRTGESRAIAVEMDGGREHLYSAKFACPVCNYSLSELEPRLFSFNNPLGACPRCDGLGSISFFDPKRVVAFPQLSLASGAIKGWDRRNQFYFQMLQGLARYLGFDLDTPFEELTEGVQQVVLYGSGHDKIPFTYISERGKPHVREHTFEGIVPNLERRYRETDSVMVREELAKYLNNKPCTECAGTRLRREARHVKVGHGADARAIFEISGWPLKQAIAFFAEVRLDGQKQAIADRIVKEISSRLQFLNNVGLDYLSLDRSAETLSGGEAQRIRLASQIGSGLTGVMYVLDEPSIGLHQRDNDRLLTTLKHLRDLGNSVIVVEHDQDAILAADYVVDMGPGAGEHGGQVVAQGTPEEVRQAAHSLTGQYLAGRRQIAIPARRHVADASRQLVITGAMGNNLQGVTLNLPVGLFVCVTGVSGSGKSTLVNDTLYHAVARHLYGSSAEPAPFQEMQGIEFFDKVISVDQSPIGRTPRSNPATYTGLFTPIRELFSQVKEARERGYGPGRFSFNVKGGRCEACQGDGLIKVEMHFLPDVYVPCDVCHGQRYNRESLEIQYKGRNIHQVLAMTVEQAHGFFEPVPAVARKLQTLLEVGLGYITLGQSATTLSGGEAQRVKLALELSKRDTGRTLYILDEPTTGLHFHDID
ncbi:MAG: excinuclease ABC subunit UvrA, partial [Pseudomonadota bacterium]|nr:excinuclease ABC subunit UvrA [Pseudomonadota bacterium]